MHILDYNSDTPGIDMSDTITRVCICGGQLFKTVVSFDDAFEIAQYSLDGECVECGTRVKLPTPLDLPNF